MARAACGRRRRGWAAFVVTIAVAACAAEPLPFAETADMKQLMVSVIEPAAETYWDSVGIIMDIDEGTMEIEPDGDEQWTAVRDAAYVMAESGNLLLLPGRLQDGDRWLDHVDDFIAVSRTALAAAEARDTTAVFDAGGEVYLSCARCHEAYAPDTLRPNFDPGVIKD